MIDRQTYQRTCALARDAGMAPLEKPTETQLQILSQIAADCEAVYEPLPGDARLAGWYLFYQADQEEEQRDSDGICSISEEQVAVIGLDVGMLERSGEKSPYPRIVALHELSHLSQAKHNEKFSIRLMELENKLFSGNVSGRTDSKEFRYDSRPYDFTTAKLVRHDSAPLTPATAFDRLTGGGAEAARCRMLDRQGLMKPERTPEQARAEMIQRGQRNSSGKK